VTFSKPAAVAPLAGPIPDEGVLRFVEGELKAAGRLDGLSAMVYLARLGRGGATAEQKAGFRLALAMYGERVDPAARDLIMTALRPRAA
jgi:hypothetical protein